MGCSTWNKLRTTLAPPQIEVGGRRLRRAVEIEVELGVTVQNQAIRAVEHEGRDISRGSGNSRSRITAEGPDKEI